MRSRPILGLCCAVLFAACSPAAQGPAENRDGAQTGPAMGPRVLRLGSREEPRGGLVQLTTTGSPEYVSAFSAGLTTFNADAVNQPVVAQKVPRVEDGDWRVLPDGQMEVTWKLRPTSWHDGTPLTAADYEFGVMLLLDPEIPNVGSGGYTARSIAGASAPDPQTVVVRWRQPYLFADSALATALPAIPRHLMWDLYQQGDKAVFRNSPYWMTEYVGIGPFKLVDWAGGSHVEGVAFDHYVLGRPKIDRIIIRILPDPRTLTVNLIAGDIDFIPIGQIGAAELKVIREAWDPIGGGQAIPIIEGQRQILPQLRDLTTPWARDVRVREAMAYQLDRQAMADILQQGFTLPADAFITPKDPTWPLLEQRGFKRRPYDPAEAQRLMAAAGWTRGGDGLYRDGGAQTLAMEVRGGSGFTQELTVVAAQWKDAGLDSTIFVIPDTTANERELQNSSRGVQISSGGGYDAYTAAAMGTAENRWAGANRGGYRSAAYERLVDEWRANAFDVSRRLALQADIIKFLHDDVAYIPLYYNVRGQAWSKAVRGPGPFEVPLPPLQSLWNVHQWEVQ